MSAPRVALLALAGAAALAGLGASRATILAIAAAVCAAGALVDVHPARGRDAAPGPGPWPRPLRALARLGRPLGAPGPGDLSTRIAAAGLERHVTPVDVSAAKGGGVLAVLLATAPLLVDGGRTGLVVGTTLAAGAFLVPDLVLRRRAAARAQRCADDLADVLDLLRVASAAGLPILRAMGEVGRRHPGLLAGELRRCADEVALGVPRAVALTGLRERCPLPAVAALAAAIARSDRHGAPLAPVLVALAQDARADRARAIADHAARAAPKIQLVVALLLVPSVLLMVAAALLPALGLGG